MNTHAAGAVMPTLRFAVLPAIGATVTPVSSPQDVTRLSALTVRETDTGKHIIVPAGEQLHVVLMRRRGGHRSWRPVTPVGFRELGRVMLGAPVARMRIGGKDGRPGPDQIIVGHDDTQIFSFIPNNLRAGAAGQWLKGLYQGPPATDPRPACVWQVYVQFPPMPQAGPATKGPKL